MTDAADNPEELKAEFKERLLWVCRVFGGSEALLGLLPVADWRRLRRWVRVLENLAVRLVRRLAAEIAPETLCAALSAVPSASRPGYSGALIAPDTDDPESERWTGLRGRIVYDSRPPAARAPRTAAAVSFAGLGTAYGLRSARRLAIRLEAAVRVVADPLSRARRLVRRRTRPPKRGPRRPARRASPASGPPRIAWLGPPARPPLRTPRRGGG